LRKEKKMFVTVDSKLKKDFSSQSLASSADRADAWRTYLCSLSEAVRRAIAARANIQRDYEKAQAEAEKWERQLQLAFENNDDDLAREALPRKTACANRVRSLKALSERYSIEIYTLRSQLTYWQNQLASY
jgi:phage shock protein A